MEILMRGNITIYAALLIFLSMRCSRDFDTLESPKSLSQEERIWLIDGNDDGEADSLQKYLIKPCSRPVQTCLEDAKAEKNVLVGYWDLESGSGSSVLDQSIYNNNGKMYNAAWTEGVDGSGILFEKLGGYVLIDVPASLSIGDKSWTLSAWVKTIHMSTDFMDVISRNECGATDCNPEHSALYALSIYGKSAFFRLRSNNTNALSLKDTTTNIADNNWHHIAGVLDRKADKMMLYVDGELSGSLSAAALDDIDDNSSPLAIGCMYGGDKAKTRYYYKGAVDEIRIYHRALKESEILKLGKNED